MSERRKRKTALGVVIGDKMHKSVTVRVERLQKHPRYGKYVKHRTRVMAHDETNEARAGDTVEIVACRPLSKHKSWRVVRVFKESAPVVPPAGGTDAELVNQAPPEES